MKPAAIGATLLLHTATVGALIHLAPGQPVARPGHSPLEVVMLSGTPSDVSARHASIETAADSGLPAKRKPESARHSTIEAATQKSAPEATNSSQTAAATTALAGTSQKSGVLIPADFLASNAKPVYPLLSRKQEEQGTVQLHILVKADGKAGEVRVRQSSGYPLLDESALNAVRNWRFHPASVNNKPVSEWYQLAIPFKLHD